MGRGQCLSLLKFEAQKDRAFVCLFKRTNPFTHQCQLWLEKANIVDVMLVKYKQFVFKGGQVQSFLSTKPNTLNMTLSLGTCMLVQESTGDI